MVSNPFTRCCKTKPAVNPNNGKNEAGGQQDEEKDVHQWDRPLEFVLSLISNSVGLGNVWRFPYLTAQNGGGAFLIPYFVLYFLIGAPLYYLELALGQFSSRGPATGFAFAKGWQGVGISMIVNSVLGMLSYNVIIGWALFYLALSFRKKLLWSTCDNWWNSEKCFVPGSRNEIYRVNGTTWNCSEAQFNNFTAYGCSVLNVTGKVTATEEFYYRLLLNKSRDLNDFGAPGIYMSLCLLAAWVAVCLCIIRGVQSSGKVAYFTALFPYIVLLTLIIYSSTLEGAVEGIKFYIIPRWHLLGDLKIWQKAASQVFFSLSLSFGSLMAYASANKFNNNFFKQMCIVVSCDCFTGIFAGFAVFATIGFLSRALDENVAKYAQSSGPGLAFITYPEALSRMPGSPFFSVIFFLMLFALGLGSQFATTDVSVTAIMEYFPSLRKRRAFIVITICVLSYIVSLPFTCPGGLYLFTIFQEYTANISLVMIGFFEIFAVVNIYGFNRFMNDIKMMLGHRAAEYYLFFTWRVSAPLLTLIITVLNLLNTTTLVDEASAGFERYVYPAWSIGLGWAVFLCCIIPVPIYFIYSYIKEFRKLPSQTTIGSTALSTGNDQPTPRYLTAFTANNQPCEDWGPKKKMNHYGAYAHLRKSPTEDSQTKTNTELCPDTDVNDGDEYEFRERF